MPAPVLLDVAFGCAGLTSPRVDFISVSAMLSKGFNFFVPAGGMVADHQRVDFDGLYTDAEIIELDDEESLRKAIDGLPCCTLGRKGGDIKGDPLNFAVIGDDEAVFGALLRQGWDETEAITAGSAYKTSKSFVFGGRYRTSPVSSLYVFGRGQDIALQKVRQTIHERNHLRLWLAPWRYQGKPVWVGQISRDIGVRLTSKTITTHKIDPYVDEARNYLIQDLVISQGLSEIAFAKGVGAASAAEPRHNFTGDPYYTDGLRAVFFFGEELGSLLDIDFLEWELPPRL